MYSITDLNTFSSNGINFTDQRPSSITTNPVVSPQTLTINEGDAHGALIGADVKEIVNASSGNLVYRIDFGSFKSNLTVTFPTLPANVSSNSSGTSYYVNGITKLSDWRTARSPTITTPADYVTPFSYTSYIYWRGNLQASWNNQITIVDLPEISTPLEWSYTAGSTQAFGYVAQIIDADNPTGTYTVNLKTNDTTVYGNLSMTSYYGANLTWASNVWTISGNLFAVNATLSSLNYTSPSLLDKDWQLTYTLKNPTNVVSTSTQTIRSGNVTAITIGNIGYYDKNTISSIARPLTIVDPIHSSSDSYTVTIASLTANSVSNIFTTGSGGTSTWASNVLTLSGTKTQVNARLGNVWITPYPNFANNFNLNYSIIASATPSDPSPTFKVRLQNIYIRGTTGSYVSNLGVTQNFVSNTPDYLFKTYPVEIVDTGGTNYSVTLSTTSGYIALSEDDIGERGDVAGVWVSAGINSRYFWTFPSGQPTTWTYSGTKEEVNAKLALIKFFPFKGVTANQSVNYIFYKDGIILASGTQALYGTTRPTPIGGTGTYVYTSTGYFRPTFTQAFYLNMNLTMVSAGSNTTAGGKLTLTNTSTQPFTKNFPDTNSAVYNPTSNLTPSGDQLHPYYYGIDSVYLHWKRDYLIQLGSVYSGSGTWTDRGRTWAFNLRVNGANELSSPNNNNNTTSFPTGSTSGPYTYNGTAYGGIGQTGIVVISFVEP